MANIIIEGMLFPLIYLGSTLTFSILNPSLVVDATFLTVYFLVTCTFYNAFLMAIIGFARKRVVEGDDVAHYFSIVIPAKNEEDVIGETLEHVLRLDYPGELFEVIVVNDGSTDKTEDVIIRFQREYPNLKMVKAPPSREGTGKASALNKGFADFLLAWRGLEVRPRDRWIIGVFDADAIPDKDMLKKVSYQFRDPSVGGVQTTVRIRNRKKSFLCKLQDIEFLTFSKTVQLSRNIFGGSVALGGNGQFVRATALDAVPIRKFEEYWKKDSLTEDLDLGVRILTKKWKNKFVESTMVEQEGVETWRHLLRQRTRWAWGHLQALSDHVLNLKVFKSEIPLRTKLDIWIYMAFIAVPFLVLLCWVWFLLGLLGVLTVYNAFPAAFTIANSFSFFPIFAYGLWRGRKDYPLWQMIPLLFILTAYAYHWIPCLASAIIKIITRKPVWDKTPRFGNKKVSLIY